MDSFFKKFIKMLKPYIDMNTNVFLKKVILKKKIRLINNAVFDKTNEKENRNIKLATTEERSYKKII